MSKTESTLLAIVIAAALVFGFIGFSNSLILGSRVDALEQVVRGNNTKDCIDQQCTEWTPDYSRGKR